MSCLGVSVPFESHSGRGKRSLATCAMASSYTVRSAVLMGILVEGKGECWETRRRTEHRPYYMQTRAGGPRLGMAAASMQQVAQNFW